MCGILFIYGPKSLERVQYSLPKLIHRGPDDQQIIIGENIALGFTRLAINGVGKVGSQPMKFQEMLLTQLLQLLEFLTLQVVHLLYQSKVKTQDMFVN